jgi:hypothetical protein
MKLLKKNDAEEFMSVTRKPKGGKKGGGAASSSPAAPAAATTPAAASPAEPPKKRLNHGLDTLQTFMKFKIEVPQTTSELPATIDKVRRGAVGTICWQPALCLGGVEQRVM